MTQLYSGLVRVVIIDIATHIGSLFKDFEFKFLVGSQLQLISIDVKTNYGNNVFSETTLIDFSFYPKFD